MPEHTPAPTPSRAVYGFVLYLCSHTFFLLYLTWAIVPEEWFFQVNITYLPQRYWAVAIPVFLLTLFAIFVLVVYPSLNLCMTPGIDDIRTVMDNVAKPNSTSQKLYFQDETNEGDSDSKHVCICKNKKNCLRDVYLKSHKKLPKFNIPPAEDLCIAEVSEILYSK